MLKFTIENGLFYGEFIKNVSTLSEETYQISLCLKKLKSFTDVEKGVILVLNKIFFEQVYAFDVLVNLKQVNASFSCVRGFLETYRLLVLCLQDKEFFGEFISNTNIDFRNQWDKGFMQKGIIDKLERNIGKVPEYFWNKSLVKGSMFSEMHSEISKMTHFTNINLIMGINTEMKNGVYLGIGVNKLNVFCQLEIKKMYELILDVLLQYLLVLEFCVQHTNNEIVAIKELDKKLSKLREEYVKRSYKTDSSKTKENK